MQQKWYVKTLVRGCLTLSAAMLLVSCTETKETDEPTGSYSTPPPVTYCLFPEDSTGRVRAPEWVCNPSSIDGLQMASIGMANKSGSVFLQKSKCAADGRLQLAQELKVHVDGMVKLYAESTGSGDSETIDEVATAVTKQITSETLKGTGVHKWAASPAGTMYCLVGMKSAEVQNATREAVRTSMGNEQALWQQFKAKQSFDEMADEIAKMKAADQ
jgi:hypothetical protein